VSNPVGRNDRVVTWISVAVFVLLPGLLLRSALAPDAMLFGSDVVLEYYYDRGAAGRVLAGGALPLWSSTNFAGYPPHATLQQGAVFYPPSWLFAILGPGRAWTMSVWLHFTLAGLFACAWLRGGLGQSAWAGLLGGLVYMLSGFVLTHTFAGHLALVTAYAWAPAVLWRYERLLRRPTGGRVALASVVTAAAFLTGYPMLFFMTALLVATRALSWGISAPGPIATRARRLAVVAGAGILGLLLTAPQLLPALELAGLTQRAAGVPYAFATTYSLPPENVLTLLAPGLFGDRRHTPYWGRWYLWEVYGFVGITTLALAIFGVRRRAEQRMLWAAVAVGGVCLALGRYALPFWVAYHAIPGVRLFRAPGRYLFLSTMAVLPLAGWGLDRIASGLAEGSARLRRLAYGMFGGAVLFALALLVVDGSGGGESAPWQAILRGARAAPDSALAQLGQASAEFADETYAQAHRSILWAAGTTAAIAGVFLLASYRVLGGTRAVIVLVTLVFAELLVANGRYLTTYDERQQVWPPALVEFLRANAQGYRIASIGERRDAGRAKLYGIDHVGGIEPMLLRRYAELLNATSGRDPDRAITIADPDGPHMVLRMLGVRYWLVHDTAPAPPALRLIAEAGGVRIYEDPRALPRVYFVTDATVIEERDARLAVLAGGGFVPEVTVVLEERAAVAASPSDAAIPPPAIGTSPQVRITALENGRVTARVTTAAAGYLVLTEADYPGWRAWADGVPTPIYRANHLVQAVRVPAGDHAVEFRYEARYLGAGVGLSLVAGLGVTGLAVAVERSRRRRAGVPSTGG
jgi:hypothetical protein